MLFKNPKIVAAKQKIGTESCRCLSKRVNDKILIKEK
jgi:hypothetical protein